MKKEFSWRTGRSCVFKNFIHLVFVTKYRRSVFSKQMLDRLKEILYETCEQMEVVLLEFGGETLNGLLSSKTSNCKSRRKT